MDKKAKVSVCMISYNHELFIEAAINSILMQETDFDFELIVSNDNSSDKTDQIIQQIILNHPNASKLKYQNQPQNLGMIKNFTFALKQCSGKYIALCDGDDYWTDSKKLQKQVNFLNDNPNYSICFHNILIKNLVKKTETFYNINEQEITTSLSDLLTKGNFIGTSSVVFKNNIDYNSFPVNVPFGDYWLNIQNAKIGKIHYFSDVMSVYHIHHNGVYGSKMNDKKKRLDLNLQHLKFWKIVAKDTDLDKKIINNRISESIHHVANNYLNDKKTFNFVKYNIKLFLFSPMSNYKMYLKNILNSYKLILK